MRLWAALQGAFRPLGAAPVPGPMHGIGRSALTIFHWKIVRARLTLLRMFFQRRMGGARTCSFARMTLRCP
ncbi:MAG: hypothetical protein C0427_01820 [Rhodobacter sp.]|nr:hypothetical protein [Rhodobacter sp.]